MKTLRRFSSKVRLPGILSDIDGVVYRGGSEIGSSASVIKALLNQPARDKCRVPFALLTNGGGIPEGERADYINKVIGLKAGRVLTREDMILCHTPFRGESLLYKYRDSYVLVSGLGRMIDLAQLYGYKKAIDIEELFSLYPQLAPVKLAQ